MTSEDYYLKGNEFRRRGDFRQAMECYLEAIALEPESPAVQAKEMLDNNFAFSCKDLYNP